MIIHVNVCPDCGTPYSCHGLDPPPICPHEYERYEPTIYIDFQTVLSALRNRSVLDLMKAPDVYLIDLFGSPNPDERKKETQT